MEHILALASRLKAEQINLEMFQPVYETTSILFLDLSLLSDD